MTSLCLKGQITKARDKLNDWFPGFGGHTRYIGHALAAGETLLQEFQILRLHMFAMSLQCKT